MFYLTSPNLVCEKPHYRIFLDVDGVLFSSQDKYLADRTPSQKAIEYARAQEKYLASNTNSYSNNYWSIVYAHHFSKKAVDCLMDFIRRIKAVAVPQIVISSKWRKDRSPEELRTIYFKMHPFSQFIIDKTPDKVPGILFPIRAEEIQYWLDQSSGIQHLTIFDDKDDGLEEKFGKRFIHIHPEKLLTKEDTENAMAADPLTSCLMSQKA